MTDYRLIITEETSSVMIRPQSETLRGENIYYTKGSDNGEIQIQKEKKSRIYLG